MVIDKKVKFVMRTARTYAALSEEEAEKRIANMDPKYQALLRSAIAGLKSVA